MERNEALIAGLADELDEEYLDDLVSSCFEARASEINNGGDEEQRDFLAARRIDAVGMDEDDLDEAVIDVHDRMATDVNNAGKAGQVRFLLADGLTPEYLREMAVDASSELKHFGGNLNRRIPRGFCL